MFVWKKSPVYKRRLKTVFSETVTMYHFNFCLEWVWNNRNGKTLVHMGKGG